MPWHGGLGLTSWPASQAQSCLAAQSGWLSPRQAEACLGAKVSAASSQAPKSTIGITDLVRVISTGWALSVRCALIEIRNFLDAIWFERVAQLTLWTLAAVAKSHNHSRVFQTDQGREEARDCRNRASTTETSGAAAVGSVDMPRTCLTAFHSHSSNPGANSDQLGNRATPALLAKSGWPYLSRPVALVPPS